jgi:phenylalanine-4-hydroxylase
MEQYKPAPNDRENEAFTRRRAEIVAQATGPDAPPAEIEYNEQENEIWRIISKKLEPLWDKRLTKKVLDARDAINLPTDHIPQLSQVTDSLRPISGFEFHAVKGLVDVHTFFGKLATKEFMSTQYMRHPSNPLYTQEPDIVHEVMGHGTLLANPDLAELHQRAGDALIRMQTPQARQFVADVWWFSGEFGILTPDNGEPKAYGAGLLSSVGELEGFTERAKILPIDIATMGLTKYRIDEYQKTLFAGKSIEHVLDTVGTFFEEANDETIGAMIQTHTQ